jgi:phage gpG-like protein
MAIEINFSIEGEKQMSRRLQNIGKGMKDFTPEFKTSTDFLKLYFTNEVFDTKGGAIGEPWKPRKNESQYTYPILEKTGMMRRSFTTKNEPKQGMVWNAVDYFKYHQSRMPRVRLPRRIMMKLTEQLKSKVVQIFHKGVYNRINVK